MIVLSLFDGISCGQLALNRSHIKYDKYIASEIDKHAITVTQTNHPLTEQIGDVTRVSAKNLPKIDLLIGGSPCQGFSVCGKKLNFEDPRSKLFFEFARILEETKPTFFLLENVPMKKEWEDIISSILGVKPVIIDSNLFSAQNRRRLYWTNIKINELPKEENKSILFDIMEKDFTQWKFYKLTKEKDIYPAFRGKTTLAHIAGKSNLDDRIINIYKKAPTLLTGSKLKLGIPASLIPKPTFIDDSYIFSIKGIEEKYYIRKLLPIEGERLQTLPDNYTAYVSNTQRFVQIGNCWTVDVISHIFNGLPR